MSPNSPTLQTIALIGSYVPRRCGIATFTKDLHDAIVSQCEGVQVLAIAMDDTAEGYGYPSEVRFQIRANRLRDYRLAAEMLNIRQVDIAVIQHEYGIYGGQSGAYILEFARRLRMPFVTTLHTVLPEPSREQRSILQDLGRLSDRIVVMSHLAKQILVETYKIPEERISTIPHGIPDVPFIDPAFHKDQFGWESKFVLTTFGLISPDKGVDTAIRALPTVVARHPEAIYAVLGATHPHLFKSEGNAYLDGLERLAARLGVGDHVLFHSRYLPIDELCNYLGATDIYITPYLNKSQIVSGTLSYAIGMGKAALSTPYLYAEELLADGLGLLFPFGDSDTLAQRILELIENPLTLNSMRKRAYLAGRSMVWSQVAQRYQDLSQEILDERRRNPRPISYLSPSQQQIQGLPDININHLRTLTDDTGILQHAIYAVPDRSHGYCSDDNSRALIATLRYYQLTHDDSILPLVSTYLSFLYHALNTDSRRFRNFMGYDRRWLDEDGNEDTQGRIIWALGFAVALAPNDAILSFSTRLFGSGMESIRELGSIRAWAFSIIGLHSYLARFSGDAAARRLRTVLAERLYDAFLRNQDENWPWPEDEVTYANARLPQALILSGQWLPHPAMFAQGLASLTWLLDQQVDSAGRVSIIGNSGWLNRMGERARFDQQPIEIMALVEACAEAWKATGEKVWLERARQCFTWFLGNNDTESMLYDPTTGGCQDGLHVHGPNLNQGAESTIAWLISLLTMHQLEPSAGQTENLGACRETGPN